MTNKMDYLKLLEHSFSVEKLNERKMTRLQYLSEHIFHFITYDVNMDALFVTKAIEVCEAISNGKTYDYIKDRDNYRWYLLMCNMQFFLTKISWGSSISGAFWCALIENKIEITSCALWDGDVQIEELQLSLFCEWEQFISAVAKFSRNTENVEWI